MATNFANASYKGSATNTASRTLGARSNDVFDLRDFFQPGDTGWNNAFTKAFAASGSTNGGTIRCPPGILNITGPIILPDDMCCRKIIGCGGNAFNRGTTITGSFRDYLMVVPQNTSGNAPISTIDGIWFAQNFLGTKGDITQVDSPSGLVSPGTGYGCLYLGLSFSRITNCGIQLGGGGVGIYLQGIENYIGGIQVLGQTSGLSTAPECVGIWLENGLIEQGKVMTCRMGIAAVTNSGITVQEMNVERNQYGFWLGSNPLAYFDRNASVPPPIVVNPIGAVTPARATIRGTTFDSHGSATEGGAFFYVGSSGHIIENFKADSFGQGGFIPDHGLYLNGSGCVIRNGGFSGTFTVAAAEVTGGSNVLDSVTAVTSDALPVVGWKLPSAAHSSLNNFSNCNTDGAVPLSVLADGAIGSKTVTVSDSVNPAWILPNGPSNVGKPIVGGGTHKVIAQWNGTAWAIAGGDTGVLDGDPVTMFLARTTGLDGTHTTAYTNLINSLVSAGLISSTNGTSSVFDSLFITATNSLANARLDLLNGQPDATVAGTVTFTADRGFSVVDGSSDNGVWTNVSTVGGHFLENAAHMSVWIANNPNSANAACGYVNTASPDWEIASVFPRSSSDGKAYYWINDRSGTTSAGITTATAQGHYIANRSGLNTQQGYKNGVDQGVVSITNSSLSRSFPPLGPNGLPFCARSNVTALPAALRSGFPGQIAAFSSGGSLTSTQVTNFYNALRTYMTAVGVP